MSQGGANPSVSTQNTTPTRSVLMGDYGAADEGSYFHAWLGATSVSASAVTSMALGTSLPMIVINNVNPVGGYNVYLRAIKMRYTTAVTGITSVYHVGVLNPTPATITSAGTAMNGPANVN